MNIKGRKDPVIFSENVGISNPFVRKALELGVEIHFHFSYIFFDLNNFIFELITYNICPSYIVICTAPSYFPVIRLDFT